MLIGFSQFDVNAAGQKIHQVVKITKVEGQFGISRTYLGKSRRQEESNEHKSFKKFCAGDWCNGFKVELTYGD